MCDRLFQVFVPCAHATPSWSEESDLRQIWLVFLAIRSPTDGRAFHGEAIRRSTRSVHRAFALMANSCGRLRVTPVYCYRVVFGRRRNVSPGLDYPETILYGMIIGQRVLLSSSCAASPGGHAGGFAAGADGVMITSFGPAPRDMLLRFRSLARVIVFRGRGELPSCDPLFAQKMFDSSFLHAPRGYSSWRSIMTSGGIRAAGRLCAARSPSPRGWRMRDRRQGRSPAWARRRRTRLRRSILSDHDADRYKAGLPPP